MKWISNARNPKSAKQAVLTVRLPNQTFDQALQDQQRYLRDKIIGEPQATDKHSVEQLKSFGMVGVYESLGCEALNELLAGAKAHELAWRAWIDEGNGEYKRPGWKTPYSAKEKGWGDLYCAMQKQLPIAAKLLCSEEVIEIGTIGIMSSDLMVMYSSKSDARYVSSGIRLSAIASFDKTT